SRASAWYTGTLSTETKLGRCGKQNMDSSGIPKSWAPGVPVGQGIFKGSKTRPEDETTKLLSRCHLFRPKNPNQVGCSGWDGWSGAPVLVSTSSGGWEVLGFLSFAQ